MNEQVYKKVGRKYVPIGYSDGWTGFPIEGIWAVYNNPGVKSSSCIASLGNFKPIDYSLLATLVKNKQEDCLKALGKVLENPKGYSRLDIIECIFKELCKYES